MPKCKRISTAAFALLVCHLALPASQAQRSVARPDAYVAESTAAENAAQLQFARLPLLFEKNAGQTDPSVDYLARANGFEVFLTNRQAVLVGSTSEKRSYSLQMKWLGSNTAPAIVGTDEARGRSNYFIGNDSSQWHTGIANYERVQYSGIYPGIDLIYYGSHDRLEYDLALAPGADAGIIRLQLAGATKLQIDKPTGDLLVHQGHSEIRFRKPLIYQPDRSGQHVVPGGYVLSARNTVSFSVGDYDHSKPLIIDPTVVYSTVLGGTTGGSFANQFLYGMAVDGQGDVYLQGIVSTTNLPTTSGSFQPTCKTFTPGQCSNFFVAKFDPTKSGTASLIYSTYIGGNEQKVAIFNPNASFQMNDIATDTAGDAYFAGTSSAANYPTTTNAYSPGCVAVSTQTCTGAAVFTKLDPTGSKLLYSTYIPTTTNSSLVSPGGVAIDSSQIVYIAGGAGQDLPSTDGSTCIFCNQAPFVAAIDTTKSGVSSLVYAEYIPFYALTALATDTAGNLYLGGLHYPTTLTWPGTVQTIPLNGFQTTTTNTAGIGPYFARFNHAGVPTYSTYIGSGSTSGVTAIATDVNGIVYAGGNVSGPVTQVNGLPSAAGYSGQDAFIARIDTTKSGTTSLLYSTYLTGSSTSGAAMYGLAANGTGQVAFTGGTTNSLSFPEVNPLTQPVATPGSSGPFIGIVDTTKSGAAALTFLSLVDGVQFSEGIAFDPANNLIIGGSAKLGSAADPFLSVPASYQTSVGALTSSPFFYKISLASASTISLSPTSLTFGDQVLQTTSASQPVTVTNGGSTPISFSSIGVTGPFAETDNCSPLLGANASCTVNVTFTSTATGGATGTLTLTDSDSSSPQIVALAGTGVAGTPKATLTPTTLAFGNQTINTASSGMVVSLSNPGTAMLTNIVVSITGTNATAFTETSNCASTLSTGASCNINVVFDPPVTGALSASVSVADDANGSPQTVTLTGTGTAAAAPVASLSPNPVVFANRASGTTSIPTVVTLSNKGNASLTISSIIVGGANPTDFAETTTCGSVLSAGSTCTISVTFTPASAGSYAATLSVLDNATGSPQTVALTGTGTTAPAPTDFSIAASPSTQSIAAGTAATYMVTVSSVGGSFNNSVTLNVAGLPSGATASFSPASINPDGANALSTLTVQTVSAQAMNRRDRSPSSPVASTHALASIVALVLLLPIRRARKPGRHLLFAMMMLAMLGATINLVGCGGGFGIASKAQTYTLTVTGTSGSNSHSTTVQMTVN